MKPIERRLLARLLCCAVGICLTAIVGCDKPRGARPPMLVIENTAEGRLGWLMERLHRAFGQHRASLNDPLSIHRTASSELFPPNESSPDYTAQVTITTTTTFRPLRRSSDALEKKKAKDKEPQAEDSTNHTPFLSDPAALPDLNLPSEDSLAEIQDVAGSVKKNLLSVEAHVEARRKVETKVYDLIYQNERWQLTHPPETDNEKLLFEYALAD